MPAHTVKLTHEDGVKLKAPISWCGESVGGQWNFQDAQHLALSVGGSVEPCQDCLKAIISELQKEVQSNAD